MRRVILSIAVFITLMPSVFTISAVQALADHECATSCSVRCLDLVNEYDHLVQANREYCNGGQVDCVLNCTQRYSDGTCRTYGPDYCARDAKCVSQCKSRYSDGSCREYDADFCGAGPITCVQQCISRYSDGSCREYGADVCGRNASCVANCIDRWSDGSCREYGADRCGN